MMNEANAEKDFAVEQWQGSLHEVVADSYQNILKVLEEHPNYDPYVSTDVALREGLNGTPERVGKAWVELFEGYTMNVEEILNRTFEEDGCDRYGGMVIVDNIPFFSHCEHHVVPFFGRVSIGYVPNKKVVGLSKMARLVDVFSKRLQIQERMTDQIADAIMEHLEPKGAIVFVQALHLCMVMRGVKKPDTWTSTASARGALYDDDKARAEFYAILSLRRENG